jgi:single-strand DNA-binding protein
MTNVTIHSGNLGKKPEKRKFESGTEYVTFSIACNESYKDKKDEWQNKTTWLNMISFKYLERLTSCVQGDKLLVRGKLSTWQKDGKSGFNIQADEIEFLTNKSEPKAKEEKKEEVSHPDDVDGDDSIPF